MISGDLDESRVASEAVPVERGATRLEEGLCERCFAGKEVRADAGRSAGRKVGETLRDRVGRLRRERACCARDGIPLQKRLQKDIAGRLGCELAVDLREAVDDRDPDGHLRLGR